MAGNINAVAAGAVGTGLLFIWSGLKGASVLSTLQSIIQGKKPDGTNAYPISTPAGGTAAATSTPPAGDTSAHGGTAAQNQALGKLLAAPYGWSTGSEWNSLVALWNQESGWRTTAHNPSGAYGIPQSLPASKMASAGSDYLTNPATQIKWGLDYIKQRYGDPNTAWGGYKARGGWY